MPTFALSWHAPALNRFWIYSQSWGVAVNSDTEHTMHGISMHSLDVHDMGILNVDVHTLCVHCVGVQNVSLAADISLKSVLSIDVSSDRS
jgi:hypothetical protein